MATCRYCGESLADGARKCRTCGEPFYLVGILLKLTPLASAFVAVASLGIAISEIQARQKAVVRADRATVKAETEQEARVAVSHQLRIMELKEQGAKQALRETVRQLSDSSKNQIMRELNLPDRSDLRQLESRAVQEPENLELQKQVYLFRALKQPD